MVAQVTIKLGNLRLLAAYVNRLGLTRLVAELPKITVDDKCFTSAHYMMCNLNDD